MTDISAIIPCYNDGKYLESAIESAINQTRTPYEIIIVDDGSTDNTPDIIERYEDHPDVRAKTHSNNRGLPAARNTGIKAAEGDVIALLDADDEWVEVKLEEQCPLLEGENIAMVYTDHYRITQDGEQMGVRRARDISGNDFTKKLFIRGAGILPSTVIIKKECFGEVGLFDERLRRAQEREMWLRIGFDYKIKHLKKPLVRRRVRKDSLGSDFEKKYKYEQITTKKIAESHPEMKQYVPIREAHLLYRRASYYANRGETAKARRDSIAAISRNPFLGRAYLRFLISCLGSRYSAQVSELFQRLKFRYLDIIGGS